MISLFDGLNFFVVLGAIIVVSLIAYAVKVPKTVVIALSTATIIGLAYCQTPVQLIRLGGFVIVEYILIQFLLFCKRKEKCPNWLWLVILCLALTPILLTRLSSRVPLPTVAFLGLSYLTFRSLQILFEIKDGVIKNVSPLDYLCFMLFFPSLSSGPIDRSRRFLADLHQPPLTTEHREMILDGLWLILQGLVYKLIIADYLYNWQTDLLDGKTMIKLITFMYVYGFYLFFDFCGYTRMAVGVAYILGIRLPKNFNAPFCAENILDFWNRWHISLSHWFRDFVFTRFTMLSMRHKFFKSKFTTAQVAYIVNMMLMGAWHGLTISYLLYGLYHGILLGVSNYYLKKNTFHKTHKTKLWYRCGMIFLTFNLVMFGFFIFSGVLVDVTKKLLLLL